MYPVRDMENYVSMLLEFEKGKRINPMSQTFYEYNLVTIFVVFIFVCLCEVVYKMMEVMNTKG
jgi:hypothetical protein